MFVVRLVLDCPIANFKDTRMMLRNAIMITISKYLFNLIALKVPTFKLRAKIKKT